MGDYLLRGGAGSGSHTTGGSGVETSGSSGGEDASDSGGFRKGWGAGSR